jgi:hypothetical protein
MVLDYSDLRREFVEKSKEENKRYGKKGALEANGQLSECDDSRKAFWSYLMDSYIEDVEA